MTDKSIVRSSDAPEPIGPYSQAVWAGNTLYISGQIALNPASGQVVGDNVEEETHQVMQNIAAILKQAGLGFDNLVKCSIFVSDLNNFNLINQVYGSYLGTEPPARETVEVRRLPKDVKVEISCIAIK